MSEWQSREPADVSTRVILRPSDEIGSNFKHQVMKRIRKDSVRIVGVQL